MVFKFLGQNILNVKYKFVQHAKVRCLRNVIQGKVFKWATFNLCELPHKGLWLEGLWIDYDYGVNVSELF